VPAVAAESSVETVACGGSGSAQRPRAVLARVAKVLERRGRLGREPWRGLGCGAEEGTQGAEARPVGEETEERGSDAGRKEKGEGADRRARAGNEREGGKSRRPMG
jgi:hypothetical protein